MAIITPQKSPSHEASIKCERNAHWRSTISPEVGNLLQLDDFQAFKERDELIDIAIIGGGIAGLSATLAAARQNPHAANIILLEKAPYIGCGATGQNAGILGAGVNTPLVSIPEEHPARELWQSTTRLVAEIYDMAKRPHAVVQAKNVGAFSLSQSETATKRLRKECEARNRAGLRASMVSSSEIASLAGEHLDLSSVKAGLYLPDEGRINPLTLLAQQARGARAFGARLFGRAHVLDWQYGSDRTHLKAWRLQLSDGSMLRARAIIVAVGPIIEANQRIYALSFKHALPADFPLFWDAAPYTYYDYRAGDGYLTVSGGRYGKAGVSSPDKRYHLAMLEAARAWLPELRSIAPSNLWAVDLYVAADLMPEIRNIKNHNTGLAIEGLGALGVLPGMVLGERAALRILRALK